MGKKVNECYGDRMCKICKGVINDVRDIEYFNDNIKDKHFSAWFRLAVKSSNFKISDLIIDLGYDINNDNRLIDDIVFYMDREFYERINYLIECGFVLDDHAFNMIDGAFILYDYLHTDDEILDLFKFQYRTQKVIKLKQKCQNKKSC